MYPLTADTSFKTKVVKFYDDTEQRWRQRGQFARFELSFNNIDAYDMETLYNFWTTTKGAYDSTWSITFDQAEGTWLLGADPGAGGVTYSNMAFEDDKFVAVESTPDRYDVKLVCLQTRS